MRVLTNSTARPDSRSWQSGPSDVRPRLVLRPTSPLAAPGMRIDPPPSSEWPTGTAPAATSAAVPPLEPPALRVRSHGLRVGSP